MREVQTSIAKWIKQRYHQQLKRERFTYKLKLQVTLKVMFFALDTTVSVTVTMKTYYHVNISGLSLQCNCARQTVSLVNR